MNRDALIRTALVALAALPLATLTAPKAHAQSGELLAPPVSRYDDRYDDRVSDEAYHWRDIPERDRIPIARAAFDREGYRLIDDRGQSIVVPFESNNLYVMRFGRTSGGMYFVNDDGVPTLYVSPNDFLENRLASGARWYPFPRNYDYVRPVYLGVAPTWNDYCNMGWYPGMVYYGGWWDYRPWSFGVTFRPTNGLFISIGSRSWSRWDDFCGYSRYTPYQRVIIVDSPRNYRPTTIIRTGGYSRNNDWNRGRNDRDRGDYRGGYSRDGGNRGGAERYEQQKDRIVRNGDASRYDSSGRGGSSDRTDRYSRDNAGSSRDGGRYDASRTGSSDRTGGFDRGSSSGRSGGFDRGSSGRPSSDAGRSSGSDRARPTSGGDRGRSADTGRSSGGGRSSSRDRESGRQRG